MFKRKSSTAEMYTKIAVTVLGAIILQALIAKGAVLIAILIMSALMLRTR